MESALVYTYTGSAIRFKVSSLSNCGGTYPTLSAAGIPCFRHIDYRRHMGSDAREARYYGSMGEDAKLPGSQIGY